MINAFTIDVEDYYHVSNFESIVQFSDWNSYESRVVRNTDKLLELLAKEGIKGTFFVLGWVAENFPEVVTKIKSAGHEIASHGYAHKLVYNQTPEEFTLDLKKSVDMIENLIGDKVLGFRAASFSITQKSMWAIDILKAQGLKYDSSVFPILHHRYGIPDAPTHPYQIREGFWEFPMTTINFFGKNVPICGGGYLRLYPYWLTRLGIKQLNKKGKPVIVYAHPWEIDTEQPRLESTLLNKFRQYHNLEKTEARLRALCRDFQFASVRDVLHV